MHITCSFAKKILNAEYILTTESCFVTQLMWNLALCRLKESLWNPIAKEKF